MKTTLEILFYDANLASPTFQRNLGSMVQNLQFGTKLHGGFNQCSFSLNLNRLLTQQYVYLQTGYRIVIVDGANTIWEGRIGDPQFDAAGNPGFTAYGYYSSLGDQMYHTAYNAAFDTVLKAMLTASCPQISSDQTQINPNALTMSTVVSTAASNYLDQSVRTLAEYLVQQADTAFNKWYMAVWENRRFYLFPRSTTTVKWSVQLKHFKTAQWLIQLQNLWNDVYAMYLSSGTLTRTSDYSDAASIAQYGLTRYYGIPNIGTVASAATAQNAAQSWLAYHKQIWPSSTNIQLFDRVYDSNGCAWPSWYVRAGDVMQITDLLPSTSNLSSPSSNALNTFYIVETKYDHNNKTNTLTFETKNLDLYAMLAGNIQPVVI